MVRAKLVWFFTVCDVNMNLRDLKDLIDALEMSFSVSVMLKSIVHTTSHAMAYDVFINWKWVGLDISSFTDDPVPGQVADNNNVVIRPMTPSIQIH